MMKKVLFVEISLNPNLGGIERVTYTVSKGLEEQGVQCYYVYSNYDFEEIPIERKLKINYADSSDVFNRRLNDFISLNNIDIVINQDLYSKKILKFYNSYKKLLGFKLVNCFHLSPDFYEYQKINGIKFKTKVWFYKHIIRENWFVHERKQMYKLCDKFVLLSDSFIPDFAKRYKLKDPSRLVAISNPLPFTEEASVDLSKKEKIALIVSRFFEIQKNLKASLRIWKAVQEEGFRDWKLEIVGYGEDEEMLKEYAKEIGLTNYEFMGQSDDVASYYRKASIFMMTSNYEGFGMTILEAQYFGCVPIVMDNFSVVHDLIDNGINGFLSKNENCFIIDLKKILKDDLSVFASAAIKRSGKTSIKNVVKKWLFLFQKV